MIPKKRQLEKLNVYLEEEQKIGIWLEKPLYRKVIIVTPNISKTNAIQNINYPHNITNLKQVVNARLTTSNGDYILPTSLSNDSFSSISKVTNTDIVFTCFNESWKGGMKFYITLEYTKTTD